MVDIVFSQRFLKNYQKIVRKDKKLQSSYEKFVRKFQNDPFLNGLHTHTVHTSLGKSYSSRVTRDLRITWEFVSEQEVLFINTGRHSGSTAIYK